MIVLDAAAIVDWLLGTNPDVAQRIEGGGALQTLDIMDVEVLSALRRKLLRGELSAARAAQALGVLRDIEIVRSQSSLLCERIWALRRTHTSYDAAYVALAEALEAPLLTTDGRLARSHGHRALIVDLS